MYNLSKLTLSSILITLIILGLNSPVEAQPPTPPHLPTIYVEAPDFVTVSTEFDIIIWIRDIPSGWGLVYLDIGTDFDPNDLEYIECEFLGDGRPGWTGNCFLNSPGSAEGGGSDARIFPASRWTEDAAWLRFRFHCLREGPAPITVSRYEFLYIENLADGRRDNVFLEPVTVIVNQIEPAPVGGVASPINKLEILTPYLALTGLIIAVSTVYVIKRRKA